MERLRRVTPKRLMMAVVLLVLLLILLNSLSWQWWQEKKHYEQCYVQSQAYSTTLRTQRSREWLPQEEPHDAMTLVQEAALQTNVRILSYEARHGSDGTYTLVLEGTWYDILSFINALEAYMPAVIIHSITLEREAEDSDVLSCHIKI